MKKISKLLAKHKLYILMLIFIGLFNAAVYMVPSVEEYKQRHDEAGAVKQQQLKEKIEEREKTISENLYRSKVLQTTAAIITFLFVFMFLTGLWLLFIFFHTGSQKRNFIPRTLSPPKPKWKVSDALRIAVIFVFLNYVFFLIQVLLGKFLGVEMRDSSMKMIFNTITVDVLTLSFIFYFVCLKHTQRPIALGLSFGKFAHNVFYGMLGYLAFLPILFAAITVSYLAGKYFHIESEPQPLFDLFFHEKRPTVLIILTIFVAILGPLIEEIFFRGFLYSSLKKRLNVPAAMFIVSLLFAGLHMNTLGFLPIFVLALALVYMFERTGSLVPSIIMHCFHNSMIIIFVFLSRFFSEWR
ncbi:MAG: type II CAAX endopeptidase family protein [Candidatus Omnitrophota bacterium]